MINPFEIQNENIYYVLINDEEQYSLWPQFADIPRGWRIVYGLDNRSGCLEFIDEKWKDQRPKSLKIAMDN